MQNKDIRELFVSPLSCSGKSCILFWIAFIFQTFLASRYLALLSFSIFRSSLCLEKERKIPEDKAAKVIMTTQLNDEKNVKMAFDLGCTIYSGKPIDKDRFEQALKKLELI